jgi:flagellar biosynthetic protein FliQ
METDPAALAVREALFLTLQLAGPPLLVMLAIGLVVSLLQALTQIQEATLAFLPKIVALAVVLMVLGPSMVGNLRGYAGQLFDRIVTAGRLAP